MKLNKKEAEFLTTLAREQNQTGCRGPAHELLKKQVYADAPDSGPGSLAFSFEAVPLIGILLKDAKDLHSIDEFLRLAEAPAAVEWPWDSAEIYELRLEEAKKFFDRTTDRIIDNLDRNLNLTPEALPQK